jgi:2-oxoglutarate ferredoxin oxidoreductase subunit alpha
MQRLQRKFATAAELVPAPVQQTAQRPTRLGVVYYGSTSPAMAEALEALAAAGIHLDALRLRAFPFAAAVADFIGGHDEVFVVEQNRDAQMKSLLVNELGIDPARLIATLHYDGTPITARFIVRAITEHVHAEATKPKPKKGKKKVATA